MRHCGFTDGRPFLAASALVKTYSLCSPGRSLAPTLASVLVLEAGLAVLAVLAVLVPELLAGAVLGG